MAYGDDPIILPPEPITSPGGRPGGARPSDRPAWPSSPTDTWPMYRQGGRKSTSPQPGLKAGVDRLLEMRQAMAAAPPVNPEVATPPGMPGPNRLAGNSNRPWWTEDSTHGWFWGVR